GSMINPSAASSVFCANCKLMSPCVKKVLWMAIRSISVSTNWSGKTSPVEGLLSSGKVFVNQSTEIFASGLVQQPQEVISAGQAAAIGGIIILQERVEGLVTYLLAHGMQKQRTA